MATSNPATGSVAAPSPSGPKSRLLLRLLLLLTVLAAAALAWFWQPLNSFAVTGASYAARVGCSCRFVGGRDLADCRKDFESGMELITLSADYPGKSVTARFPLLATQTATYREGEGCRLQPWAE
ncbi:hypothetical protein [Novosphingobium sp.]|uniref:hypothetical protein n=1 Tax=Novosphingobium sp. TaxID=1874826 RepID=UPI00273280E3|nr:hypothetical protein [Novosphingobium sp.]MDP3906205.1 hypothetical protein [Novosphingobium sp.]